MQVYGIDLLQERFDVNFLDANGKEKHKTVKNGLSTISRFLSTVRPRSVLCVENTETYGDLLAFLCNQCGVSITLVPGYTVKSRSGKWRRCVSDYHDRCGDGGESHTFCFRFRSWSIATNMIIKTGELQGD